MKRLLKRIPVLGPMLARLYWRSLAPGKAPANFAGSRTYWEDRYADGRDSGVGSYGKFASFKAEVLNQFVSAQHIGTVIEFGCGDGNQLGLATYPAYLGFDVSPTAIKACREKFAGDASRRFKLADEYADETAELTLSLDVLYHLVEDPVFDQYMSRLFDAATRYVIVYSSDTEDQMGNQSPHVRHRRFSHWVSEHRPGWRLLQHIPNRYPYTGDYRTGSFADFHIFERNDG